MAIDLARQLAIRWPDAEAGHVALLREVGAEAVLTSGTVAAAFAEAAGRVGIAVAPEQSVLTAATAQLTGLWPGIRRPGKERNWDNDLFASASAEPWIDSNLYAAPLARALGTPAALAYPASAAAGLGADRSVPFGTLEAALVEARVTGGNFVLAIEPRYRAALLAGEARARAAWASLGRTARWLAANAALFGRPAPPTITALVEPGPATREIANLLYRRNGSPRLVAASAPGALNGAGVIVAASLKAVPESVFTAAASLEATVAIDDPALVRPTWTRIKEEPDRGFFRLGSSNGRVVVYRKRVADPSEFALDMIDLVGHRSRTARLWNAQSAVVFAADGAERGEQLLVAVNYGEPQTDEVQARLHGTFTRATLLRPESGAAAALKTQARGLATEVFLPGLERVAVVRFRA